MKRFHRLEDALPAWRTRARRIAGGPASGATGLPFERIATACLAWMAENECWPNKAADTRQVAAEIEAALRQLVVPSPPSLPSGEVRGSAWAITAAAGSALGALALSPLTYLWFDNRLIGLFAGGTLGAFLAVKGVGALLERPRLVAVVRSAAALSSGGVVIGAVWRAIRFQSLGLGRSVLWLLAAPLVMSVLQPRATATATEPSTGYAPGDLARAIDMALAVAWAHPDRLGAVIEAPRPEPERLPRAVVVALTQLQSDLARGSSDRDIRDSCDDLLQRLQESGYAWVSISKGTPFDPDMAALFEVFGTIPAGQGVRTQRAAMTRHGEVVQKGELRRV
jgi:hypothetical protein